MIQQYFIYILVCKGDRLYTGYTTDIDRRYQEHVQRLPKCKFTRSFPVKSLAACWSSETDYGSILKVELAIKKLSRAKKLQLIHSPNKIDQFFTELPPKLETFANERLVEISVSG